MPCVTAVTPQKRSGRYNVYLDGRFALGLDELTLAQSGLRVGNEIGGEELVRWQTAGELGKLYDKVLRFLATRPRSVKEVQDYLRKKISNVTVMGGAEGEVGGIVARLKRSGLVDDGKFTQWWVEQRQEGRQPKGRLTIEKELRQKGVAIDVIREALARRSPVFDEKTLAQRAAAKKSVLYRQLPPREFRQKMAQFLLRRGFAWPVVREVVKSL